MKLFVFKKMMNWKYPCFCRGVALIWFLSISHHLSIFMAMFYQPFSIFLNWTPDKKLIYVQTYSIWKCFELIEFVWLRFVSRTFLKWRPETVNKFNGWQMPKPDFSYLNLMFYASCELWATDSVNRLLQFCHKRDIQMWYVSNQNT